MHGVASNSSVRDCAVRIGGIGAVDLKTVQQIERILKLLVVLRLGRNIRERARLFLAFLVALMPSA